MRHLVPFAAGVLTGAVALRLLKADKPGAGLQKAQAKLRGATASGLEAIENASARARGRLGQAPAAVARANDDTAASVADDEASPASDDGASPVSDEARAPRKQATRRAPRPKSVALRARAGDKEQAS